MGSDVQPPEKERITPPVSQPVNTSGDKSELKVLYSWKAPTRPFKKRDREFWTTVIAIVFLVALILFFVKEWFLIAAVISLTFVYYVLSTVKPEEIDCVLNNKGVFYVGQLYPWEGFFRFWFSSQYDQKMVNLDMRGGLVSRLSLMVGEGDEAKIKETLSKYLTEETPNPTLIDNAGKWLQEKVTLGSEKDKV